MRELTETEKALKAALRLCVERIGGVTRAAAPDVDCVMLAVGEFAAEAGGLQNYTLRAASDGRFSPKLNFASKSTEPNKGNQ